MADDPKAVAKLRGCVRNLFGLKWLPAIEAAARDAGWLAEGAVSPAEADVAKCVEAAVPKETALFRNEVYWPAIAATGAKDVWCAGCATGEEAFSIALVLPKARVVATDLSRKAIAAAETGVIGAAQLEKLAPNRRGLLRPNGAVAPDVRARVVFRVHNLARDQFPSPFDLIVCRNVFVYLESDAKARIVERFTTALRPGGRLLLSSADRVDPLPLGLSRERAGEVVFLRRV